jgi:lipopolysaccharide export LptBFGC system permease protein LptF
VTALDVILVLFAAVMVMRNGPIALRIVRGERGAGNLFAAVTVLLALAILVVAVKSLTERLLSR